MIVAREINMEAKTWDAFHILITSTEFCFQYICLVERSHVAHNDILITKM